MRKFLKKDMQVRGMIEHSGEENKGGAGPELGAKNKMVDKAEDKNFVGGLVVASAKEKKTKRWGVDAVVQSSAAVEVDLMPWWAINLGWWVAIYNF